MALVENKPDRRRTRARIPPSVLGVGILLWRFVSWLSNVDFLFSFQQGTLSTFFQFISAQGWWILLLVSVLWFFMAGRVMRPRVRTAQLETIIAACFISFMFGVLVTVQVTESAPRPFTVWGIAGDAGCTGTVATSRLQNFSAEYEMAMICVLVDPSVDKLKSTMIAKTSLFVIADTDMFAPFSGEVAVRAKGPVNAYHALAILPKNTDMEKITSLADVQKYKGRILTNDGPL